MVAPLDVFAVNNGEPRWVGCAETLVKGLELAVINGDGLYFVFSQQTGHKKFYNVAQRSVVVVQETDVGGESERALAGKSDKYLPVPKTAGAADQR